MIYRCVFPLLIALALAQFMPADARGDALRILKSKHYRIHTDIEATLAEDLAFRLDAMYDEYSRRLADFRTIDRGEIFDVYLFDKKADYLKFTGGRFQNTGGIFMPGRNLLAAYLEGQGRAALRRTLQHEAFHQFAHTAISPNLPVWLNEGIAQLFEEGLWTGNGFWLGQVPPRRLRQLDNDIQNKRLVRFDEFMNLTHEQWSELLSGDREKGATYYNQAWAMAHYLVNETDDADQPMHRARLIRLLKMLREGNEFETCWNTAFSSNIQGFQDRFVEFATSLEATPEASIIERQSVLADLCTLLNKEGASFDNIGEFRKKVIDSKYQLAYSKGTLAWKTDPDAKVYFSDLNGQPYDANTLFFESRWSSPLPDIVCRCSKQFWLRTRFYKRSGEEVEHEVMIEPAKW